MANGNGADPAKRAMARPQMYIDVHLADGQKFIFDVDTAKELRDELGFALDSLTPPEIAIGDPPDSDPPTP